MENTRETPSQSSSKDERTSGQTQTPKQGSSNGWFKGEVDRELLREALAQKKLVKT